MKGRWRAVIGAVTAPNYIGGLGSYQRGLAAALEGLVSKASSYPFFRSIQLWESQKTPMPWPVKFGSDPRTWTKLGGAMLRLAARPVASPCARIYRFHRFTANSLNKLIGKVDWIHFVGTGHDYLGFALVRLARKAGVRFTVWPAVHPRDWGDDVLDVRLYRKADAVMCQTSYEKRHLAELGVPESKLLICGLPPMCLGDGNADSIRRELELGNRPCVLFLGRRDEGKGLLRFTRTLGPSFCRSSRRPVFCSAAQEIRTVRRV